MQLIVLGLNNKTASIDIREKIYFSNDNINKAYSLINQSDHIYGSVILSTCNRVEIYCSITNFDLAIQDILKFISNYHGISQSEFLNNLYIKKSNDAIEHLFKVISSLDSMVIGEDQIQGQIRDAYLYAFELSYTNTLLNKVFQTAIQLGKRIRTETKINHGSVSIGSIATDLILEKFEKRLKILILGAGDIAELTLTNLVDKIDSDIYISNRTEENAIDIAKQFNANVCNFENRKELYPDFDVIIASTSSKEYIVTKDDTGNIVKKQIYIDLSVPRNIDPDVIKNENISLYTIEDFSNQLTSNKLIREEAISDVKVIIREEAKNYYDWYATQTIIPVMKGIKVELTEIASRTVNEHHSFMNTLNEDQQEKIKTMLLSSNDKLIRVIMKNLKSVTQQADLQKIASTLKNTFNSHI
jgi:glutamyl-tRNA reductase